MIHGPPIWLDFLKGDEEINGPVGRLAKRVFRIRENRYKIHLKTPILPSSGQILINLICGHTKSTIPYSTRGVSTAVKNLTSR